MRYYLSLILLIALPVYGDLLSDKLNHIQQLQADFKQVQTGGGQVGETIYQGHLSIAKPNRFRWTVDSPSEQVIVADGHKLWVYDVDLAQVTVQPQAQSLGQSPARLLAGRINDLQKEFSIKHNTVNGIEHFALIPKEQQDMLKFVSFSFANDILQQMVLIDGMDQKSVFYFSGVKLNAKINPNDFVFKPPKGTDVIGEH